MENKEIQIKTNKIDFLKLIDLTLDRKDWGKIHTLYVYGDVVINIIMSSFDFKKNTAIFEVVCDYNEENKYFDVYWYNKITIEYHLSNFELSDFERVLQSKIFRLIEELVQRRCLKEAQTKYSDLLFRNYDITEEQIRNSEFCNDYDYAENLSYKFQEEIQDSIKDKICDSLNVEYYNKVDEYKKRYVLKNTQLQNYYNLLKREKNNNG